MGVEKRGLQGIRTISALLDNRRARTPAGALLELSTMANEKTLLQKELARWKRRHAEIQARLGEIAAKEQRLLAYVQNPNAAAVVANASGRTPTIDADPGAAATPPFPQNLRVKEFTY